MRKLSMLIGLCSLLYQAQGQNMKQTDTLVRNYQPLIPMEKVALLKNMNMIANMQNSFRNEFVDGEHTRSAFVINQFRLELRGKIHDRVSFRFRDRYTRGVDIQSVDNISRSTDIAAITVDLDRQRKWSLSIGKLCADWGGYEFDYNPIDIYEYNDIVEFADNFLAGVQLNYIATPDHSFTFQILNSRTASFQELYGQVPGVREATFPSAANLNWRGSFNNGKFTTLWSLSGFQEAKQKYMYYVALGNYLDLKPLFITYDFKYSFEELDRKTIVSTMIPDNLLPYAASDVSYLEHWLKLDFNLAPKWNLSLTAMSSVARWRGDQKAISRDETKLRTSYGIIPAVEFRPFKDLNLKFFANYVGRFYRHTDYAKNTLGNVDFNRSSASIGFISPLRIF